MIRSVLAAVVAALVLAAPAGASQFQPGAPGLGDPFFPLAGNGGYDVRHYALDLEYDRASNQLDGRAIIFARAEQNLSSFNLDLRGYEISDLEVNGRDAQFARDGQELTVTPRHGLRRGSGFLVRVEYSGNPEPVVDPDESLEGWVPTDDGAFVVNEPQGSPGWYPANDNPQDKATYSFAITVPEGITAIANGRLLSSRTRDGKTTWRWFEDSPMAPYLATATNGVFELRIDRAGRIPLYQAVDPKVGNPTLAWERLSAEAEIIGFFSELYGRYPFSTGGGVVDNGGVGYALESQTKPMYDVQGSTAGAPSAGTVVHEIAHQWFGNAVTLAVWPDIWLNEGFATLLGVDLHREPWRHLRAPGVPQRLQRAAGDQLVLAHPAGRHPGAGGDVLQPTVRPRRHDAAGAAREDRRRGLLRACCAPGTRSTSTATRRPPTSSRSPSA